jgi:hypothetical protein
MVKMRKIDVRIKPVRPVQFVCPRCEIDSTGQVLDRQRWFRLCGLPVARLTSLDPRVECDSCGYQAGLGVLDIPTAAQLAEWLTAAMRASVAMVLRAGRRQGHTITDDMTEQAIDVMVSAGHVYDGATLMHDLDTLLDEDADMCLTLLHNELSNHGKQGLLQRLVSIALADGRLNTAEQRALVGVGVSLGMAAPHINGVLATAVRRPETTY